MAALKEHVKLFIVQRLACFDTPSEVAAAVADEFSIEIDRSHVSFYDPTTHKGRELGKKFRDVFEQTRKALFEETSQIPIANRGYRIRELQKSYNNFVQRKNYIAANQVLEQAAKEVGDYYTNKIKVGGDADNPFIAFYKQISGSSINVVQDAEIIDGETFEEPAISFNEKPAIEAPKKSKSKPAKAILNGRD